MRPGSSASSILPFCLNVSVIGVGGGGACFTMLCWFLPYNSGKLLPREPPGTFPPPHPAPLPQALLEALLQERERHSKHKPVGGDPPAPRREGRGLEQWLPAALLGLHLSLSAF